MDSGGLFFYTESGFSPYLTPACVRARAREAIDDSNNTMRAGSMVSLPSSSALFSAPASYTSTTIRRGRDSSSRHPKLHRAGQDNRRSGQALGVNGSWDGVDWHDSARRYHTYIRVREQCLVARRKPPGGMQACTDKNASLLGKLENASLLMFGDSIARGVATTGCAAVGQSLKSYLLAPKITKASPYWERATVEQHTHDHHGCRLLEGRGGGLPIGYFAHYGITGPPYWTFAYPLPPWINYTTGGQVQHNLRDFTQKHTNGCDPTLIVINSAFWDISSWWLSSTNKTAFLVGEGLVEEYALAVQRIIGLLRTAFPSSSLAWRTVHDAKGQKSAKRKLSPKTLTLLNSAATRAARSMGVFVIDTASMVRKLVAGGVPNYLIGMKEGAAGKPGHETIDGRHLNPLLDVAVLNMLLNVLAKAQAKRHTKLAASCRQPRQIPSIPRELLYGPVPKEALYPRPGSVSAD